jgi:hypothetical protein
MVPTEPLGSKGWKLGLVPFATVLVVNWIGGMKRYAEDWAM